MYFLCVIEIFRNTILNLSKKVISDLFREFDNFFSHIPSIDTAMELTIKNNRTQSFFSIFRKFGEGVFRKRILELV